MQCNQIEFALVFLFFCPYLNYLALDLGIDTNISVNVMRFFFMSATEPGNAGFTSALFSLMN